MSDQLAELLREAIRAEQTTVEALTAFDAFTDRVPATLTSAWGYLEGAREHAFTCLDPDLRRRPARLGGPELGTGVLERLMRELAPATTSAAVAGTSLHHPPGRRSRQPCGELR